MKGQKKTFFVREGTWWGWYSHKKKAPLVDDWGAPKSFKIIYPPEIWRIDTKNGHILLAEATFSKARIQPLVFGGACLSTCRGSGRKSCNNLLWLSTCRSFGPVKWNLLITTHSPRKLTGWNPQTEVCKMMVHFQAPALSFRLSNKRILTNWHLK